MAIAELISALAHRLAFVAERDVRMLGQMLVSPGSTLSLWSVASAVLLGTLVVALRRGPGKRRPRWRVWIRALFPARLFRASSTRADVGFFLLNTVAGGGGVAVLILAAGMVAGWVRGGLTEAVGPSPVVLPAPLMAAVATAALFLAYEVAYFLDHYISHKVPFFWAFHKPHHTAEVLTPLTNFRVHPIESLKFGNIVAVIVGGVGGSLAWLFGGGEHQVLINETNLLTVVFLFTLQHLQHTHFWIATTGAWGRVLLSPAHHQIHHSDNPAHFNRNFGSCLAVWDWLAGTLYVPSAKRERLNFGVGAAIERPQSITGTLITPFVEAIQALTPKASRRGVAIPAE